jgi:hypothetical protein
VESFRGFKIKGRKGMSSWACIMEEWMLSIERYTRIMGGDDAPYYYNERANVSVLAGAAWRSGWVALEEFQSEKGYRNKAKTNGRTDLYFANESDEELIEAKFQWICLGSDNLERMVRETMELATSDAKRTRANSTDVKAIGVGFFPVYKKDSKIEDRDELIEQTIIEFGEQDYHAMGWCFPPEMRDHVSETKGNLLPGVIMLAKNIDH